MISFFGITIVMVRAGSNLVDKVMTGVWGVKKKAWVGTQAFSF